MNKTKILFTLKIILTLIVIIIITSCKSTLPDCYKPAMKNLIIRWGERIRKNR